MVSHQSNICTMQSGYHRNVDSFFCKHLLCHVTCISMRNGIMNMEYFDLVKLYHVYQFTA